MKIAIIGGSGLNRPDIIENRTEKVVKNVFGEPSDAFVCGKIGGVDCVLLCRHGRHHTIPPTQVNYRANIWALKELGCTNIVATTACGSLRENIRPGHFVLLDQFIDRTTKRMTSFYDGSPGAPPGVCHIPMTSPFCHQSRKVLAKSAKELGLECHLTGTNVTIEGPRFSTRAESKLLQSWGADVVNMTTVPEVVLAAEAGISYAAVALVTDYDSWRENEEGVSKDAVLNTLKSNVSNVTKLLIHAIPKFADEDFSKTWEQNKVKAESSVM